MRPGATQPQAGSTRQRKPHGGELQQEAGPTLGAGQGNDDPQHTTLEAPGTNAGSEQGAESVGDRIGNAWPVQGH